MKKLIVVLASLLLVTGFAFIASAADPVKFSGELDWSMMEGMANGLNTQGFYNFYTDIDMTVDQYNVVRLEIGGVYQSLPIKNNYFYLQSDIGNYFDLPIGLVAQGGITSLYSRLFEVTGHGWERVIRPHVDPLAIEAAADFSGNAKLQAGFNTDGGGADLLVPKIGPASVELYWYKHAGSALQPASKAGAVGGNIKATGLANGMLSVAGMFVYDTDHNLIAFSQDTRLGQTIAANWQDWAWGAGASLKYNIVTVGVSANGYNKDPFNLLAVDLDAKLTKGFGVTGAMALSFAKDADTVSGSNNTFDGADLSVYITPQGKPEGAALWRVGYSITKSGYTYGSNVALPKGGLYITNSIDF